MRAELAVLAQQQVQQQVVLGGGVLDHPQSGLQLLLAGIPRAQTLHALVQVVIQLHKNVVLHLCASEKYLSTTKLKSIYVCIL